MQKQSAFMNFLVKRFTGARQRLTPPPPGSARSAPKPGASPRARRSSIRRATRIAILGGDQIADVWRHDDCANEPNALFICGERRTLWALGAKTALILLFACYWLSAPGAVHEVGTIGLTVADLDREREFYTTVLPFEPISERRSSSGEADDLLGLSGTELRSADLKLGSEQIALTEHLTHRGHAIPANSRSFDHWFQHIAIVVRDMDRAYEHLRNHHVKHVSTAPQTLPAWNKDAGGIKAFYFRDPEDHVLEIIWFPPGKGDPRWQEPGTNLFLGIDHTAIVVADTEQSLKFYRDLLGMRVEGGSENYGTEQEHLNQVFGARLRITALRADHGPGIEFLEYITPPGGRSLPPDAKANDLVFWRTDLRVEELKDFARKLHEARARFASRRVVPESDSSGRSVIVRDPDGHALELIETPHRVQSANR